MAKDTAVGAILEIPPSALQDIKRAEDAIKQLQATSQTAAQKIKGHFDNTAVSGLDAFIKKVQEAQGKLGNVRMPQIDATSFASSISQIAQAMATVDKSATTGANRISHIADSITKLSAAQPSAQMFQDIANGITAIGNTSQQTIANVSQLAQAMAQLARDIRTVQNAQRAQANDTATAAQYNKLYKEQSDLIRQMNAIKEKGSNATLTELSTLTKLEARYREIDDQLNKLNKKKQTAASELASWMGERRTGNAWSRTTVSGAINYAQQAKSLKELQDAFKNLKAVMATVDPKSDAWRQMNSTLQQTKKNIDEIRQKMGEFNSQSVKVSGIVGQLRNSLALAFSVSSIKQYVSEMIKVRAQFELQNVALRAILQNKDEADRIFAQVQQMALQSPFTIMQLTTYTKQLAAYRIEADKLVGTTKMLADVSAGLGVDIQRLILAYGQVKAANYLRATEIRQFTEAGLNIAGELAQYFSELQGKMVSVGDVMDMVTKRMVRFEDVEEVFKRVTSAGGLFYDMQKKQAETLSGQIQRISDAYSIMLNEIGKSNQSTISDVLTTIRSLISNWRTVAAVIKDVVLSVGAYYAVVKGIAVHNFLISHSASAKEFIKQIGIAISSAKNLKIALASMSATGWGLLIAGLTSVVYWIYEATSAASALQESLDSIQLEGTSDMYDLIGRYRELAEVVRSTNEPYEKRKEALDELSRTYKSILPDEMLEIENIRNMTDGYAEATEAIKTYSLAQMERKAEEAIQSEQQKAFAEFRKQFTKRISFDQLISWNPQLEDIPTAEVKGVINRFLDQVYSEVDSGITDREDFGKRFKELFASFYDIKDFKSPTNWEDFFSTKDLIRTYDTLYDIYGKFDNLYENAKAQFAKDESYASQMQRKSVKPLLDDYKELKNALDAYGLALQKVSDMKFRGTLYDDDGKPTEFGASALQAVVDAKDKIIQLGGSFNVAFENIFDGADDAINNNIDLQKHLEETSENTLGKVLASMKGIAEKGKNNFLANWVEEAIGSINKLSETQVVIRDVIEEAEDLNNVDLSRFQWAMIDGKSTVKSVRDDVKKDIDSLKESMLEYTTAVQNGVLPIFAQMLFLNGKTLEETQKIVKAETQVWKELGGHEKKKGKGRDPWQDKVSLIKEMNTEYEKLLRYYNESEAKLRIQKSYAEAVAEAFKGIKVNGKDLGDIKIWQGFDKEGMIAQLRAILDSGLTISKEKRAELQKMLAGFKATIDIEIQENAVEKMKKEFDEIFANYDLTKELGNLGLNVDLTYLVGGKPMTLAQARKELQDTYDKALAEGKLGEDAEKAYKDALKKLDDIEHKAQVSRLKNYNKYLLESMSERVQIELNAQREIAKIRQSEDLDETTKQMAILREQQDMKKKLASQEWKDFQGSDSYIQLFEDIEQASTKSIEYVLEKLRSLRGSLSDLPADQLRAIMKQIDSLEKQVNTRNPFKALKDNIGAAIKAYKNLGKAQEDFQKTEQAYLTAKKSRDDYAVETSQLEEQLQIERAKLGVDEFGVQIENKVTKELEKQLKLRREELGSLNDKVDSLEKEKNKFSEIVAGFKKSKEAAGQALQTIGSYAQEASSAIGDIASSLENVFGSMSDDKRDTIESIQEILGGVGDMASGVGRFLAGDMIGGSLQAVKGLASTIGSIFAIGDKKKERQIQRLVEKVDTLDNAYQRLEKSIEDAYTFDDYNVGYKQMQDNLEEQKAAYEEMIRLEEAKKKTDDDKIKEYKNKLQEIADAQEELRKSRIEVQGSTTDYLNEAQSFVDAWLDAYKETGNGLDALGEKWEDFIENLFIRQGAAQIVSKRLAGVIEDINKAIEEGKKDIDLAEAVNKAREDWKKEADIIEPLLEQLFGSYGLGKGNGDFILSDLQKGIQNITEPQAAAIEAYLNSMRFAVFKHTEQLDTLITTIQAQYGSGAENPVVTELKGIRGVLDNIDRRLASVINTQGRNATLRIGT